MPSDDFLKSLSSINQKTILGFKLKNLKKSAGESTISRVLKQKKLDSKEKSISNRKESQLLQSLVDGGYNTQRNVKKFSINIDLS